jgi:hypothetical protein
VLKLRLIQPRFLNALPKIPEDACDEGGVSALSACIGRRRHKGHAANRYSISRTSVVQERFLR